MFKRHSADQRERREAGNYLLWLAACAGLAFLAFELFRFSFLAAIISGYQHFAFWEFWCGPNPVGASVGQLMSYAFGLGLVLLLVSILGRPLGRQNSLYIFFIELLFALVFVGVLFGNGQYLTSGHCRAVNDPAYEQTLGAVWGENWIRPQNKSSKYCQYWKGVECWHDADAPPFDNPNVYTARDRLEQFGSIPFGDTSNEELASEIQRCLSDISIGQRPNLLRFEFVQDQIVDYNEARKIFPKDVFSDANVDLFPSHLVGGIIAYRDNLTNSILIPAISQRAHRWEFETFSVNGLWPQPEFVCRFRDQKYVEAQRFWWHEWLERRAKIARKNLNNRLRLRTSH